MASEGSNSEAACAGRSWFGLRFGLFPRVGHWIEKGKE